MDDAGALELTAPGVLFEAGAELPAVDDRAGRPFPSALGVLPLGAVDPGIADPGALDPGAPDGATVTLLVTVSAP